MRSPSMNRNALPLSALLFLASSGVGCATYVPFTAELRDEHHLTGKDLENLQFYNSHPITLRRVIERDARQVTPGHKLLVIAGKQIEEVVIDEHTPGVVVGATDQAIDVSFEEGTSLRFSLRGPEPIREPLVLEGGFATPPNPFPGNGGPQIVPEKPRTFATGNFWLTEGNTVDFVGRKWDAIGETLGAHLEISTESLEEVEEARTVLKGRKL